MGLKADQTPQSFCIKAWLDLKLATCIQNASMRFDFQEKKIFLFFSFEINSGLL